MSEEDFQGSRFLILGPPGVGKSSLINCFAGEEKAKTGKAAKGVTTEIQPYVVGTGLAQQVELLDVPGYGGNSGNPYQLSKALHAKMGTKDIHGVIICVSMDNIRLEMANHFVTELLNHFIKTEDKWDKIIFVLTKFNKAEKNPEDFLSKAEAIAEYKGAVKEAVPLCSAEHIVTVGNTAGSLKDLAKQVDRLAVKKPLPKVSTDVAEVAQTFIGLMESVWGIGKEQVIEEMKKDDCFAPGSTVRGRDGNAIAMRDLRPGNLVQDRDGYTTFAGFIHVDLTTPKIFVALTVGSSCITLTTSHLLMLLINDELVPTSAASVMVGDVALNDDGVCRPVRSKSWVEKTGFLAPLTASGTLFVDGVLASCYPELPFLPHWLMHAAMSPICSLGLTMTPPDDKGALHWYPFLLRDFYLKLASALEHMQGANKSDKLDGARTTNKCPWMLRV